MRPGGTLVYSTCSLTRAQNEDVISAFLAREATARLHPLEVPTSLQLAATTNPTLSTAREPDGTLNWERWRLCIDALVQREAYDELGDAFMALHTAASMPPAIPGRVPGTLRFEPLSSGCSGLFIARLTKVALVEGGRGH